MIRRALPAIAFASLSVLTPAQTLSWQRNPTNGHWYAVTSRMTWHQGEALARMHGGHLATIRSQDEQDWVYRTFGGAQSLWIGFTDEGTEGRWGWSSGEPVTYTNWSIHEPNNLNGVEHWAHITPAAGLPYGADGRWNDNSNFSYAALIERVGYRVFGSACPGSNGLPTLTSAEPRIGAPFQLHVSQLPTTVAPPEDLVAILLGVSNTTWWPFHLPLSLDPAGMTGCTLYVSGELITWIHTGGASSLDWPSTPIYIPNDQALIGASFFLQVFVRDPGVNPAGFTTSNAVEGVVGT